MTFKASFSLQVIINNAKIFVCITDIRSGLKILIILAFLSTIKTDSLIDIIKLI